MPYVLPAASRDYVIDDDYTADVKLGGDFKIGVTNDLTARFNAVDLVKKGAEALGGKGGGGRPDMAQAGGPDGAKADAALAAVEAALGG